MKKTISASQYYDLLKRVQTLEAVVMSLCDEVFGDTDLESIPDSEKQQFINDALCIDDILEV